jgi:hypothetical protein
LAERRDPWASARAKAPGYGLLRVIDANTGADQFRLLRPRREDTADQVAAGQCDDQLLDGCTLITPEAVRTPEEVAAIVAAADARRAGR